MDHPNRTHPDSVKRVELDGGGWAMVRRITPGDIRAARVNAHERGWEDSELDSLFMLPRLIVEWSLGDVTQETVDEKINEMDYLRIWATAKGAAVPNPSSPSSGGSGRRARTARQSKGQSSG